LISFIAFPPVATNFVFPTGCLPTKEWQSNPDASATKQGLYDYFMGKRQEIRSADVKIFRCFDNPDANAGFAGVTKSY